MAPRLEPPICGRKISEVDQDNWGQYHDTHHFMEDVDTDRCLRCGTGFFTSLTISNGYLTTAHKARAIMRMAEYLELVDPVDKLEALVEADAKRQTPTDWRKPSAQKADGDTGKKHLHGLARRHSEADGRASSQHLYFAKFILACPPAK